MAAMLGMVAIAMASYEGSSIHLVTFGTANYFNNFKESLQAKQIYANFHGHEFSVFTDSIDKFRKLVPQTKALKGVFDSTQEIDCDEFRPVRWMGDWRYCKLRALQTAFAQTKSDILFWHDLDTHIMQPGTSLNEFVAQADNRPLIFTENGLSLNNGAFFMDITSTWGRNFFQLWSDVCDKGEWPWADNGCMLEAVLQSVGGNKYDQTCGRKFKNAAFDKKKPHGFEQYGSDLSKCYNKQMESLGHPCCGDNERGLEHVGFLTQNNSFNHHSCTELLKPKGDYKDIDRAYVKRFCFRGDSSYEFIIHEKKDLSWGPKALTAVKQMVKKSGSKQEL
jgi:hypothetical protein